METTTYEQQAIDFLTNTQTSIAVIFLEHGKHFQDDEEDRDIYEVTLQRGTRKYVFRFGQSIVNSGFYYTKGVQKTAIDRKHLEAKNLASIIYKTDFYFLNNGKSDIIHYPKAPTAYDVLTCITKSDPGDFENFCSEYGYDTDSRKAKKTYKAVRDEWYNVSKLFSDTEIQQLQEIQ